MTRLTFVVGEEARIILILKFIFIILFHFCFVEVMCLFLQEGYGIIVMNTNQNDDAITGKGPVRVSHCKERNIFVQILYLCKDLI